MSQIFEGTGLEAHDKAFEAMAQLEPAFPIAVVLPPGESYPRIILGLTKRELFAAMAMQGLTTDDGSTPDKQIARLAVGRADALLAELEKGK